MAVVSFNLAVWTAWYPALAASLSAGLTTPLDRGDGILEPPVFTMAQRYVDNSDSSPIVDLVERQFLINLMVAHIAALNQRETQASGLVGAITGVTQGSVSISLAALPMTGSQAFYNQTSYGAQFWAATAKYRVARYIPGPRRFLGVPGYRGNL
jgi:hypothetical protein